MRYPLSEFPEGIGTLCPAGPYAVERRIAMKKGFLLSAAAVSIAFCSLISQPAQAGEETGSLLYMPIPQTEREKNYQDWKLFIEYNMYREPCQNYWEPPSGYDLNQCRIQRFVSTAANTTSTLSTIMPAAGEPAPPPALPSPTAIYFDFDRSNIRASEQGKLNDVVRSIRSENPAAVVIAGHADRAGPEEYNVGLSQRRAQAVADAMVAQGVNSTIIDQKAYGETMPAVATDDGVPLQENRRAVIEMSR